MRLRFSIVSLVVAVALGVIPALAAPGKGTDKGAFMKTFAGPDSFQAKKAIEALDPDVETDFDLLKQVIQGGTWFYRSTAATVLAKTGNKKNLEKLLTWLSEKKEQNAFVREGAAVAIAKMNDKELYPKLFEALDDKDPRVRRTVADKLKIHKDKGSIDALIARWKKEKDPIVINFIRETLESMTQRFLGADPQDWDNWWVSHKDKFEIGSTDEEAKKKAEEEGKALAAGGTSLRDVDLSYVSRGIGAPVIILPEYGLAKEVSIPFFYDLEKAAKLYYMKLPQLTSFKNLKQGVGGKVYYPLDQLVDAFDEFRKTTKSEKIAIMATGMNCWIAMKFASKYPQRVACLVFISPVSSLKEDQKALDRMIDKGKKTNDIELWHWALTQLSDSQTGESEHDKYHKKENLAVPEGEEDSLHRKSFSRYFGDQQDSMIDYLFPIHLDWPGNCLIPDFSLTKTEVSVKVPILICHGRVSMMSSEDDCNSIAKFYGGAQVVSFDRSGDLPMVEEPEKFNKLLVDFFKKYAKKPPEKKKD